MDVDAYAKLVAGLVDQESIKRARIKVKDQRQQTTMNPGINEEHIADKERRKMDERREFRCADNASEKGSIKRPLWVVLPDMLTIEGQNRVFECLDERCHSAREAAVAFSDPLETRETPLGLEMQPANQPICNEILLSALAHTAFEYCRLALGRFGGDSLDDAGLLRRRGNLTALGWMYGPHASMEAHFDSPTFAGSKDEWLVSLNVGLSMRFAADDSEILIKSGDVLVMDTLNVRHGVLGTISESAPLGCPVSDCRLGVMLWESYNPNLFKREQLAQQAEAAVEGVGDLFGSDGEESDDDG